MKLVSRKFEFEQPLQPGMQSPVASPAPGWDPYDVWSTRVRSQWLPVSPEKPASMRVSRVGALFSAFVISLKRSRLVTAIKTASPP